MECMACQFPYIRRVFYLFNLMWESNHYSDGMDLLCLINDDKMNFLNTRKMSVKFAINLMLSVISDACNFKSQRKTTVPSEILN